MRSVVVAFVAVIIPLSSSGITEFDAVLNSYGKLRTAAGRGMIGTKGVNGWETSMEGGMAVDAELSRPHMTTADREGNLYIADKDAHAVRKVTPQGTIHTIAGTNEAGFNGDGLGTEVQLDEPNGLFTFPDGTTYILDMGNNRIRRLSISGVVTTIVHDTGGIVLGRGLWVSEDESLIYYVSGSGIRKWTPSEGVTTFVSGFTQLGNIAVDPTDGNLVVTDRGTHTVSKVFPDGSRQVIAGNGGFTGGGDGFKALETALYGVRGVCFGPNGGYYLATHEGGQVWYVDTGGYIHLLVDGDNDDTHAGDGQDLKTPGPKISEPRAVALAPDGDLLITENDSGYVRVVERIFVVLETSADEQGATLTWSSLPGDTFAVQIKGDLNDPTWQDLGNVPAKAFDIQTSFAEPAAASEPKRFYRVFITE